MQPILELKAWPKFRPINWSLSMLASFFSLICSLRAYPSGAPYHSRHLTCLKTLKGTNTLAYTDTLDVFVSAEQLQLSLMFATKATLANNSLRRDRDKHSSLFVRSFSDEEKSFIKLLPDVPNQAQWIGIKLQTSTSSSSRAQTW